MKTLLRRAAVAAASVPFAGGAAVAALPTAQASTASPAVVHSVHHHRYWCGDWGHRYWDDDCVRWGHGWDWGHGHGGGEHGGGEHGGGEHGGGEHGGGEHGGGEHGGGEHGGGEHGGGEHGGHGR